MKCAIIGDREIEDYDLLLKVIKKSKFKITEVISGGAKGVDTLAERYSREVLKKEPTVFKPDWNDLTQEGAIIKKKANPWTGQLEEYVSNATLLRNTKIIDNAECCIALPSSKTNGTRDGITKAKKKGIPIHVHEPDQTKDEESIAYEYFF